MGSVIYLKALKDLQKDLRKLKIKAELKKAKEEEKAKDKFIKFKGNICHTHEDIDDVYRYDGCSSSECDKAHERLAKVLKTNCLEQSRAGFYLKIVNNYLYALGVEIDEEEFRQLPPEERKRILEESEVEE